MDGQMVGCITGFRIPERPDTIFIWQVAVSSKARGRGLALRMLTGIFSRPENADVRNLEVTVGPSNTASLRLFAAFAREAGVPMEREEFLSSEELGGDHEAEDRYHIGPWPADTFTQ